MTRYSERHQWCVVFQLEPMNHCLISRLDVVISYYARTSIGSPPFHYLWGGTKQRGCSKVCLIGQTLKMAHSVAEAGWIGRQAILMTGFNSIIYVLSTLPP